jgi:hypothetical protein
MWILTALMAVIGLAWVKIRRRRKAAQMAAER